MLNQLKAVKRNLKRYRKNSFFRAKFYYTKYFEQCSVKNNEIFFESYSANNFSGNVYYLFLEIEKDERLSQYKKFIACRKSNYQNIKEQLEFHGITNYELVYVHSKEYCKKLCECKYIFNNSTLPSYFIKKKEQVYFNTWHGTPLKTLGRSIETTPNEIGNTQRNFFMADYLLYPNKFTFNHMKEDYMLDQLYNGSYIIGGYPRNNIFYNTKHQQDIRERLELTDKEVICYMPTWRGTMDNQSVREQIVTIEYYLYQIDKQLKDNQVMYVNLHNFVKAEINMNHFKNIYEFPSEYETYEFLSIADCLITDYSSVFFDFANTGRKIILFAYDKKEYFDIRGVYFPMEDLPFPIVENLNSLYTELSDLHKYDVYDDFVKEFCKYDKDSPAKKIIDLVFFNEQSNLEVIDGKKYKNNKKNVLIFAGSLAQNGLTTSLRGLIHHVDPQKYNFTILFYRNKVKKYNYVISDFPHEINYISIQGQKNLTYFEAFIQFVYMRFDLHNHFIEKYLSRIYKRELLRIFYHNHFDVTIHFTGYEKQIANLFNEMENTKRIIYVHNDMRKEKKTRANYHIPSIMKAYENFDNIVAIRESMIPEIMELSPHISQDKIKVVHNTNNIEAIVNNAQKNLVFDDITESTHSVDEINAILNNKNFYKFINVARFSPEKGIKRLIKAYEKFYVNHPDTYLFVIGGLGIEFQEIYDYVIENNLDHIVIIKSLSNVFPILTKCDIFIMSSLYEGLPMSIMEALILGKPVVCTNITGPREFLCQGYGHLVDDSTEGVYQGFVDGYERNFDLKEFDAIEFNKTAIKEFYAVIE